MKACINCHTENSDDTVSCSESGMSLTGAPSGEEAMKLKELAAKPEAESRPRPEQPSSVLRIWLRAVTRPVLATYEDLLREEPNPTLSKAVAWIAIAGLVAGAVSGLLNLMLGMAQGESGGTVLMFWVNRLALVPAGMVIEFVIFSAISLAIARASGGEGNLGSQSYLLAAAQAPVSIISVALATIPSVGGLIAWLAMMYVIYPEVLAMRAAHRFGWYKAVGTLLWAAIVLGALYCIYVLLMGALGLGGS